MSTPPDIDRGRAVLLLASVFVIATCGLVYELVAGTLSSYLLGSSVTQFSLVIGLYLTAMGVGSFLSRFVEERVLETFLVVELWVGIVGGLMPLALFYAFAALDLYQPLLFVSLFVVGALVGLEIPLLVRLVQGRTSLREALGNVLALDYLGALAASVLFPLVLVPRLGLVRTGALFGLLNVGVAALGLWVFRDAIVSPVRRGVLRAGTAISAAVLAIAFVTAGQTTRLAEDLLYDDEILFARTTPYQRLVFTRWKDDIRLYIDGNLQFSSVDEFRYHESLVHPAMALSPSPRRVLVLGGGDGMVLREVLKHQTVETVDLVDLDPAMTRLFTEQAFLVQLNGGSLSDERVTVHNEDAQKFLEDAAGVWDVIVIDLPDPNNETLARLYTRSFYRLVARHLTPDGLMVTQATSPFYSPAAFWCVVKTLEETTLSSAGGQLQVVPYHVPVPSFGDWGFVMASRRPLVPARATVDVPTRYLTHELLPSLFLFGKDVARRDVPVNRLDDLTLVRLYEDGYRSFSGQ